MLVLVSGLLGGRPIKPLRPFEGLLDNGCRHFEGIGRSAQVVGAAITACHLGDGVASCLGGVHMSEVLEHQRDRQKHCARVGPMLAGIGGRAAMYGFEVGTLGPDVCAGRQAQSTHDPGPEVGKNVAEHVFRHDHPEALGPSDHPQRNGVDVIDVALDVGKISGNRLQDLSGERAAVPQDVGFIRQRDAVIALLARVLEGKAEQAQKSCASLQAHRHRGVGAALSRPWRSIAFALSQDRLEGLRNAGKIQACIEALGVLSNHRKSITVGAQHIGNRPHIGKQPKFLAKLDNR